jgi:outer membrane protein assembly factor BamE
MPKHLILVTCLASGFLASCSWFGVYKLDVNQGNVVTQEMVDQLRPGMNKRQVAFIMGTPLLVDVFHQNRWDYVYSYQPGRKDRVGKKVSLLFQNDELVGIEGDFRPGDLPVAEAPKETTVVVPKLNREKTVWQKIKGVFGFND